MKSDTPIFDWRTTFLTNWNFMRIVRLVLAIFILMEAYRTHETFYALAGGLFLVQSVFNWGCCGSTTCNTRTSTDAPKSIPDDITFEEITGGK